MVRCAGCGCAYLDPRPTPETIHLAYAEYYTHGSLQRGSHQEPVSSIFSRLAVRLISSKRVEQEKKHRHLARATSAARLLDVGFGDGKFLEFAASSGYQVAGCEIDPATLELAKKRGFDVRNGGIESFDDLSEEFDVITLGHAIEHVHDPKDVLHRAYRLLKPGGTIWIETPNIKSYGHDRFGEHWRGLEPPRHLVIFNWAALEALLKDVGFGGTVRKPFFQNYHKLAKQSQAISTGSDPNVWESMPGPTPMDILTTWMKTRFFHPEKTEFITLFAQKPLKVSDKSR